MLTLTEKDNGRRLAVHAGDEILVELPENASTGYRWAIDGQPAKNLELVEASARYPGAKVVGAGGTATFHFRVTGPGSGRIALKHGRSWEGDRSVVARFAVSVKAGR